jgi:hypothetical protein
MLLLQLSVLVAWLLGTIGKSDHLFSHLLQRVDEWVDKGWIKKDG